jgi:hypothetical protein
MRIAALILAAGLAFTLGGCVKDDGPIVPKPLPSSTPIFASDEEALAAAEEAFGKYLALIDQISADGGAGPDRLSAAATPEVVAHEKDGFEETHTAGERGIGRRTFDSMTLQSADINSGVTEAAIAVYVCEDFSATDILDAAGNSVVSPTRQLRYPLEVFFDLTADSDVPLLVSNVDDWTGEDFCIGQ